MHEGALPRMHSGFYQNGCRETDSKQKELQVERFGSTSIKSWHHDLVLRDREELPQTRGLGARLARGALGGLF